MKNILMLLSFLLFISAAKIAASNQDQFDVIYYEIDISINPETEIVDGSVNVQAISEIDGLTQLTLDFYDNMTISSITGNANSFIHSNDLLVIDLDRNYNQGETVSVNIFYSGHPEKIGSFNPMTFDKSRSVVTISSESCPYYARCWWPCKDRPDDKPLSMDIKITVPSNLTAASNGALIESINNGDGTQTFHWQVRNPIPTYLVAFTITDYQIMHDEYVDSEQDTLQIMHFVYPEHYNAATTYFAHVNQSLDIFSSYYGKYPYMNEKYGIAEYVGYWAGMEYQTLTCVGSSYISEEYILVHELAHQWWGDCVSPKNFHHSWVSEGFAVFSEALYFGFLQGQEKYHNYMNNENSALDIKGIMYRHDISNPNTVYASIVYNKGAWVLHMLRHVVGEDNFWAGLQEYFARHQYSSATTEDLQQAFETVVADSLDWFFHQWVYEPNYPQYSYGWQEEPTTGGYIIKLFIDQIQSDAPLFKMPVDVTLISASSETTVVVMVDDSTESFLLTPSQTLVDVKIDKDDWILKKSTQFTSPVLSYYNHVVDDSAENNNSLAEPNETVNLTVSLWNGGLTARTLTAKLISDDDDIEIQNHTIQMDFWDDEGFDHLTNETLLPFTFSVNSNATGHISTLKLEITANDNYSTIDSFDVKIGNPNVLLVDDDNGANYEQYFYPHMAMAKVYNDNWDIVNQGNPDYSEILKNYQTVIWFTGDDRETSLTSEEQQTLAEYLDNGGKLILTGQNIGFDLIEDGTTEDSTFFTDYLHAEYIADSMQVTMIIGVPSDPISAGLFLNIDGKGGGAGNQNAPSIVNPINGAQTLLKYIPGMASAGIRYMDEAKGYCLVYLPFGYEGISGPYSDSAEKFLSKIFIWFSGETDIKLLDSNLLPKKYLLAQNYPNPFNPVTKIQFMLPKENYVTLSIYNLRGQKIKDLVSERVQPGIYEKIWDGTDFSGNKVSSGMYIYKLKSNSYSCSKKLLMLK